MSEKEMDAPIRIMDGAYCLMELGELLSVAFREAPSNVKNLEGKLNALGYVIESIGMRILDDANETAGTIEKYQQQDN